MPEQFAKLATAIDDVQRIYCRYVEAHTKVGKLATGSRDALAVARTKRDTAYLELRLAAKVLATVTSAELREPVHV
jgi:hypothetical protein